MNNENRVMFSLIKLCFTIFLFNISNTTTAQSNYIYQNLKKGHFNVGFTEIHVIDYARIYKNDFRTVQIALWYPLETSEGEKVKILDYFNLYNTEDKFEDSVDIKKTFGNQFKLLNKSVSTEDLFESNAMAISAPFPEYSNYPLVLYAAGGQGESIENFLICEILASNGFVVAAVPSIGTYIHQMEIAKEGLMTQTYDLQVALRYLNQLSFVDKEHIGTFGWSWGGLSAFYMQSIYPKIKAFISLDGSMAGYRDVLKNVPFYSIEKITAPGLFFTSEDTKVRTKNFVRKLVYANSTFIALDSIDHSNFNSYAYLAQIFADIKQNENVLNFYPYLSRTISNFFVQHLKERSSDSVEIEENFSLIDTTFYNKGIEPPLREDQLISLIMDKSANDGLLEYKKMKRLNQNYIPFQAFELTKVAFSLVRDSVRSDESLQVMEMVLEEYPKSASSYALRGRIFEIRGEYQQALADFKKALSLKEGAVQPEEVVFYEDINWYKKKIEELEKK